jgi:hypothetical protein
MSWPDKTRIDEDAIARLARAGYDRYRAENPDAGAMMLGGLAQAVFDGGFDKSANWGKLLSSVWKARDAGNRALGAARRSLEKPYRVSNPGCPSPAAADFLAKVKHTAENQLKQPVAVRYAGPNTVPSAWLGKTPRPGMSPPAEITLNGTSPFSAGHEIGHLSVDSWLNRFFGEGRRRALESLWSKPRWFKGYPGLTGVQTSGVLPGGGQDASGVSVRGLARLLCLADSARAGLSGSDNAVEMYGLPFVPYLPALFNESAASLAGVGAMRRLGAGRLPFWRGASGIGGLLAGTASYLAKPALVALFNAGAHRAHTAFRPSDK